MSLKSFNITMSIIFAFIYMVGLQLGDYVGGMFGIGGYIGTGCSLTVVFVIAALLLGFRMTLMGWIYFVIFGFLCSLLGQWIGSAMALSGIVLSFITGILLYFLLTTFTKTKMAVSSIS